MLVLYGVAIMTAKKSMREVVKNVERIRSAVKAKVDSINPGRNKLRPRTWAPVIWEATKVKAHTQVNSKCSSTMHVLIDPTSKHVNHVKIFRKQNSKNMTSVMIRQVSSCQSTRGLRIIVLTELSHATTGWWRITADGIHCCSCENRMHVACLNGSKN